MERTIRAEALIEAPRERVWQVLVDFPRYAEWNPFTPEVRARLEVGASVDMRVRLWSGLRHQREYVRRVVPGERLCWGMHMGAAWLVRAERCQWLEALDGDRTRYVTEDRIAGWLTPLVLALYGRSMQRGFEGVAQGLKGRVESGP
jgi:uncharacterized protein YndB with AHSA1/START domain